MQKGEIIDANWVVEASLGRGGMGQVYRCHHVQSDRILAAIKVLAGGLRDDTEAVRRFVREAEILHRLDHPSVVKVRSVRVDADPPYIEMEYVEGVQLGKLLVRDGVSVEQAIDFGRQLFSALDYLHRNDVRHRDIKPENVLIRDGGRLVLVDFGLALDSAVTRLTVDNVAFGTVAYAPPEWLSPGKLDPVAWDLYAAGVLLWEMVTGDEPFPSSGEGPPRQQALQVMLGKQATPGLDTGPEAPPALRALVRELTDPEPGRRPKSSGEALSRLDDAAVELEMGWSTAPLPAELVTADASEQPTQVPPPYRAIARETSSNPVPRRSALPWIAVPVLIATAFGAAYSARIVLAGAPSPAEPSIGENLVAGVASPGVAVALQVAAFPDAAQLAIAVDGRLPREIADGVAQFDGIHAGPRTVQWAYGTGCALNACPGSRCPSWCGSDQLVIDVREGSDARFDVPFSQPRRAVSVLFREMQAQKKGARKRRELVPWGKLAGIPGRPDGDTLRFDAVPPGEHTLVVSLGECPAEAADCSHVGNCPAGCSSEKRLVRVSWDTGPVVLTTDLPLPQ